MNTMAVETRDERRKNIGRENFTRVLLIGTKTADPRAEVARLAYQTRDCSSNNGILNGVLYTVC